MIANAHDIYERYARDVHRFALYLSGDPALADDITAERSSAYGRRQARSARRR
jgi:DNA-directed RNA polymerase specialized sigma24 family protein